MELGFAHGPLRALGEIPFRSGIRRVGNHGLVQHLATLGQGTLDDTLHLIYDALHPPAARRVRRCQHSAARPVIADALRTPAGRRSFPHLSTTVVVDRPFVEFVQGVRHEL